MRATLLSLLLLPMLACTRGSERRAPVPPLRARTEAVRTPPAPQPLLTGETPTQEIIERIEETSEFAGNEAGLTQLVSALFAAIRAEDSARIESLLGPVRARRSPLLLAMTFEGGRTLVPYLVGPNATANSELRVIARRWTAAASFAVTAATGAEIARGERAGAYDPAMRRISAWLREGVRFYRLTLRGADGQVTYSDPWVYAGGRWMFLREPWRFAPESPDRTTVIPTPTAASRIPPRSAR
ncbi:MAG: hypothetical protein Q8Q09_26030 [Deltaproteobacteria bacterium]|nr:hypothetical protein [Deltaproteobacteria bacterium]